MSEQKPNPVVVAVGQDPVDAALVFAAEEAARAGCGIHLVHVVHVLAQGPQMPLVSEIDVERIGRQTLDAALERARHLVPDGVPVSSEMRSGKVVPTLVEMTADARLVVMEHRELSRMRRVVTRSTSSGLAAHSRVPVALVPAGWTPDAHGATRSVAVGLDVLERSREVLRAALEEAHGRGAGLHVIHTWDIPDNYGDLILDRSDTGEWDYRAVLLIQELVDSFPELTDGVDVTVTVRHARPADALIEAGEKSQLLVVGRHDSLLPFGSHLGPISRAVVREAACPVLVVDPRTPEGAHERPRAREVAAG